MVDSLTRSSQKTELARAVERRRTIIIFDNFGPYHLARLRAAAKVCDLKAIQIAGRSAEYAWDNKAPSSGMTVATLFQEGTSRGIGKRELRRKMDEALDEFQPELVLLPGWASPAALQALSWCIRRRVAAVMMSESTEWDEQRRPWRERIKQAIVGLCAAALVGGRPHQDYLVKLGMPPGSVFLGYDVVDNDYFTAQTSNVRNHSSEMKAKYSLPENYFLASARFVGKKNLFNLLSAYACYRKRTTVSAPWSLVLLGDGPLRADLTRLISHLQIDHGVLLPGFKQYPELPVYYGCAGAFIHASTTEQWGLVVNEAMASALPVLVSNRCGCARDLVQDNVNGFTFDPANVEQLAQLMLRISDVSFPRLSFGDASRRIICDWGPERFAAGLQTAAQKALVTGPAKPSLARKAVLYALLLR